MTPLPITLLVFTSTAQHFGFNDVYQTTLDHIERTLGTLDVFARRIAHIKVRPRPEEERLLPVMLDYFARKGIETVVTRGDWARGMSHQNEYLRDIHRMVSRPDVQSQPFTLWVEDDSPIEPTAHRLEDLLGEGCRWFADQNVLAYRFARLNSEPTLQDVDGRTAQSPVFHFQPSLCRSRDLLIASNLIAMNWPQFETMQCEWAFTVAMRGLLAGRGYRFLVARPETAYSYHIGTPEYPAQREALAVRP